jgi:ribosome recycling factor
LPDEGKEGKISVKQNQDETEEAHMYHAVIKESKAKMEKTRDFYQKDMLSLRAGRANPQILDRIVVDYYGTQTPLRQMGNINSPEPRLLTIALWDPKAIPLVEKAIQKSDLGMNPSNDGKLIRLVVPELNEERRKELTKLVRKGAEEAKVAIRGVRGRHGAIQKAQEGFPDHRGRSAQGRGRAAEAHRRPDQGN